MRVPSSNATAWTREDEALLAQLAAEGKFIPDIARQLGRSQQAVQTRAQRLKLRLRSSEARRYPAERAARKSSNAVDPVGSTSSR